MTRDFRIAALGFGIRIRMGLEQREIADPANEAQTREKLPNLEL